LTDDESAEKKKRSSRNVNGGNHNTKFSIGDPIPRKEVGSGTTNPPLMPGGESAKRKSPGVEDLL
jgi:hypothetical protein